MFRDFLKSKTPYDDRLAVALPPLSQKRDQDMAKIAARIFASDDGKALLQYLQITIFQRALSPDAPDTQLRYYEGQRAMLANLIRLIEKGQHGY